MKSRAIIFVQKGEVELKEIAIPDPSPSDIVVRTEVSGVSVGTERWALLGMRPEIDFPNVPGYMGIGVVEAVGKEAAALGYVKGQRVDFSHSRMPPEYDKSWMGTHLSRAVVRVSQEDETAAFHRCTLVPEGCDPVDASISPLCAVALRGIEMATVRLGDKVLVVGLGVIGQFASQVCRLKGARVCAVDVIPRRVELARRLGADWALVVNEGNVAEFTQQIAPDGFDIIIDTSSKPSVVNDVFPLLRWEGKFVFQGWYPPPSELDLNVVHGRQPTCYFPCGHSTAATVASMRWMAEGKINSRALITHLLPPTEAPSAYRMMLESPEELVGVAFDWR